MATYKDLEFDWSMLCQECTDCWTPSDLQIAAELGKMLLERNKELENSLKQHQDIIEDQTQEIEYLTKQTAALREVNNSRLQIYEQLEVSIQELERNNQRQALDNSADKKNIKSLCLTIDWLESRCEELQRDLDEVRLLQNSQLRRQQRSRDSQSSSSDIMTDNSMKLENETNQHGDEGVDITEEEEEMIRLLEQLQEVRSQRAKEQQKISDLEEQLAGLLQENMALEKQLAMLHKKKEDKKSLNEEIFTMEDVRQGHLSGHCLRDVDSRGHDVLSMMSDHEEDDASVVNSIVSETHCSMIMLQIQDPTAEEEQSHDNPYRVLVEKYEVLIEMQRHPASARQQHVASSTNCLSLQEELRLSGDFSNFNGKIEAESDEEGQMSPGIPSNNCKKETNSQKKAGKAFSATAIDFSEAETSSSRFSDETSNKATQTEGHLPPGSFLGSITDGDDCRFSIHDDTSPKVPPVTPTKEEIPDDLPRPKTAPKQDILEYLSVGVSVRKKSHAGKNSSLKPTLAETVEQIESVPSACTCTGMTYANGVSNNSRRKRREINNSDKGRDGYIQSSIRGESSAPFEVWKKVEIQNSNCGQQKPLYSRQSSYQSMWDFQPFISSASQEVAKLKRIEKSYSEVLRLGPQKCSNRPIPTNGHRK